jgi:hypothetical protein
VLDYKLSDYNNGFSLERWWWWRVSLVEIKAMMLWWVLDYKLDGCNGRLNLERMMIVKG